MYFMLRKTSQNGVGKKHVYKFHDNSCSVKQRFGLSILRIQNTTSNVTVRNSSISAFKNIHNITDPHNYSLSDIITDYS